MSIVHWSTLICTQLVEIVGLCNITENGMSVPPSTLGPKSCDTGTDPDPDTGIAADTDEPTSVGIGRAKDTPLANDSKNRKKIDGKWAEHWIKWALTLGSIKQM